MITLIGIALIALCAKIWTFHVLRRGRSRVDPSLYRLLVCTLFVAYAQSVLELFGIYMALSENSVGADLFLIKAYHFTMALLLMMLPVIVRVMHFGKWRRVLVARFLVLLVFGVALFSTDLVITGVTRIEYTFTRVPGEYYWAFKAIFVASLIEGIYIARRMLKQTEPYLEYRSKVILFSVVAFSVVAILVVALMNLGVDVSGAGISSIAFALLLYSLSLNASTTLVFDSRIQIRGLQPEYADTLGQTIKSGYAGEGGYSIEGVDCDEKLHFQPIENTGWGKRLTIVDLPSGEWKAQEVEGPWPEIDINK